MGFLVEVAIVRRLSLSFSGKKLDDYTGLAGPRSRNRPKTLLIILRKKLGRVARWRHFLSRNRPKTLLIILSIKKEK